MVFLKCKAYILNGYETVDSKLAFFMIGCTRFIADSN